MPAAREGKRLVWRIYLYCVVFVVLPAVALFILRPALQPPTWVASRARLERYILQHVAERMEDPAALKADVERAGQEVNASIAIYAPDGTPLAQVGKPLPALSADELKRLEERGSLSWPDERRSAAAIVRDGRMVAYGEFATVSRSSTTQFLAILILVALLAAGIAAVLLARAFTRPLQRLAEVAGRLGDGDLSARVGLDRRDELGRVGRAFDDMAARLDALLRSQKELLANVSHELRTPLSRIRVALDIAAEGDAAGARESLGEITVDLGELERLVDDILTTARLDVTTQPPLHLERVTPEALVGKAATRFRSHHPARELSLDVAPGVPEINADTTLLRRALDNLLDNAAKYSEEPTPIVLRTQRQNGDVLMEVVDRGIGIPDSDRPHLFTPFFRTDRSRARKTGGVGLGLALAKRIVEAHGGALSLADTPGGGTTVRVTVPIAEPTTSS